MRHRQPAATGTPRPRRHRRPGEEIRGESCGVTTQVQPFHYLCTVSYRDKNGGYRGNELRLVQSVPGGIFHGGGSPPSQGGASGITPGAVAL